MPCLVETWYALPFVGSDNWDQATHRCAMPSLELDWCKHAKCRVPALAVVEDLEVREDGVGQLDPGPPRPLVQELDLHAAR